MGESDKLQNHYGNSNSGIRQQQQPVPASQQQQQQGMMRIVEVEGGHIVRSMGRKDRHSKVCTAKGPRDRRVRLSAHTAIKFYDVQDRLGYDRPSKAVDWLIKNAKPAIDELDQLPPWQPSSSAAADDENHGAHRHHKKNAPRNDAGKRPAEGDHVAAGYGFHSLSHHHHHQQHNHHHTSGNSSFLPPSLDSDVIADTIKSFFPIAPPPSQSPSASASPCVQLESCPNNLFARSSGQLQDLRLSLHSSAEHALFEGAAALPFDASAMAWPDQAPPEMGRSHRAVAWNTAAEAGGSSGGGYFFGAATSAAIGHAPIFTQRGPLQSSNSPSVRAWTDLPPFAADHQIPSAAFHPLPSIPAIGFTSGGFSGFCIPARIQGEDEHDAGGDSKPPSTSSAPRH